MTEQVSRAELRQALADRVPETEVVAGRICMAAMRRAGLAVNWSGDECYFAAESLSEVCFGQVNAAGTEVTGSTAEDGGCLRLVEIDGGLDFIESISPRE